MKLSEATKNRTVKAWREASGYWADLKAGLRCSAADTHTCREDTLPELEEAVARAKACECDDCTRQ